MILFPTQHFIGRFPVWPKTKSTTCLRDAPGRGVGSEFQQLIYWGGSALLSSSILAAAIKAYVAHKKRKIVITIGDKKLEYEGPDLAHAQEKIEAMIDKLTNEEGTTKSYLRETKRGFRTACKLAGIEGLI